MSRKVKGLMQDELTDRFKGLNEFVVVSVRGIGGIDNNDMREDLSSKSIRLNVVKNSLAKRAFEELSLADTQRFWQGPSAVAYGGESIVDVVKALVEWGKKLEPLSIKGGYLEGKVLDGAAAEGLAKLPSRSELQGNVVALAQSPGARLAGAIGSGASYLAGCIKTLADKEEAA